VTFSAWSTSSHPICTTICLALVAAFGGYRIQSEWLERWGNSITAAVLTLIGALVFAGAI
jgi:hypothetical protein